MSTAMSTQPLKLFLGDQTQLKLSFSYPDRVKGSLTKDEKEAFDKEEKAVAIQKNTLHAALEAAGLGKFSKRFKLHRTLPRARRGTGPIATGFHLLEVVGEDAEGKTIYKEYKDPAVVKFHSTATKRNSYEQGRQYAMHKFFKINGIERGTELYDAVVEAYETRAATVAPFAHNIDDVEGL